MRGRRVNPWLAAAIFAAEVAGALAWLRWSGALPVSPRAGTKRTAYGFHALVLPVLAVRGRIGDRSAWVLGFGWGVDGRWPASPEGIRLFKEDPHPMKGWDPEVPGHHWILVMDRAAPYKVLASGTCA